MVATLVLIYFVRAAAAAPSAPDTTFLFCVWCRPNALPLPLVQNLCSAPTVPPFRFACMLQCDLNPFEARMDRSRVHQFTIRPKPLKLETLTVT